MLAHWILDCVVVNSVHYVQVKVLWILVDCRLTDLQFLGCRQFAMWCHLSHVFAFIFVPLQSVHL